MRASDFSGLKFEVLSKYAFYARSISGSTGGGVIPAIGFTLSDDGGKTWTPWFSFNRVAFQYYLQTLKHSCNLMAK